MLFVAFNIATYAQNCSQAIPNPQFQQKYNQINNKPTESAKLNTAKQIVKSFCFSSSQIKEIAALFENDYDRFEFAKAAYHNVTDKENFYDVYDAFIYYSLVFRLHDYVQNINKTGHTESESSEIEFPNYNYPSHRLYRGERNCSSLIPEQEFDKLAKEIYKISNENEKYNALIKKLNDNCFATAHLMKLASLFSNDRVKLNFSKQAIKVVYDIDNYKDFIQVFSDSNVKREFIHFVKGTGMSTENECSISDTEFRKIVNSIQLEKFNSTKVNTAKHLIQTKKCLSSDQIKEIIVLFSYENTRLDIAFFAYDFVKDKANYYTSVSQSLQFESSKKQLLDYIKNKN